MTESDQRVKILKNPNGSPRNFTVSTCFPNSCVQNVGHNGDQISKNTYRCAHLYKWTKKGGKMVFTINITKYLLFLLYIRV